MRFGDLCQTIACRQVGATTTTVADGERRWDLLLCDEHAERVQQGDETHVLVAAGGRPALSLGSVLKCGGD